MSWIWIEIVPAAIILALAFHQLYAVRKAQRERIERERAEASTTGDDGKARPDG